MAAECSRIVNSPAAAGKYWVPASWALGYAVAELQKDCPFVVAALVAAVDIVAAAAAAAAAERVSDQKGWN